VTRLLILAVGGAAIVGCSHREDIPKITREEWFEVHRNIPWGDGSGNAEYFASPRGQQLVSKRLRHVFGDLGLSTMKDATRVETFRIIDPSRHESPKDLVGEIERFPIIAKGEIQGKEFAVKMSTYLLDGKLYFFSPDCIEDYGVAYRLWKGSDSVSLIVCYECYNIQVFVRDAEGRLVHEGGSSFRDAFGGPDVMRELAKLAFPSDAAIQAL
jgi:hypothetical protein